ncbi:MAG: hypothetical protein QM576_14805 [Rhodopseudomonas sp.]|uniref:hypothetical protein n=1 Tax=Rhodopseudomonas sp. TaxID=1078 RepID=UPI0039E368FB
MSTLVSGDQKTIPVIASVAKQFSGLARGFLDCFVAEPVSGRREAPIRVLLAMTEKIMSAPR